MSERKVLNKYYPPDFDPSKIPRMKLARNRQYTVRLMAPFNMRCKTCGEYIYKGKKFNARKEDVEGDDYLGIRIYRFYIKCTRCLQEISFKTDPQNTDYEIEAGATRNFMALKLAEEQAQREEDEKLEEEATNPMKLLEKRTQQSKQELELLESLEELKDLNRRQQTIDYDQMLEQYDTQAAKKRTLKEQEELDEQYVKSIFKKKQLKGTVVEEEVVVLSDECEKPPEKFRKVEDNSDHAERTETTQLKPSSWSQSWSTSTTSNLLKKKSTFGVKILVGTSNEKLSVTTLSNSTEPNKCDNKNLDNKEPSVESTKEPEEPVKCEKSEQQSGLSLLGTYSSCSSDEEGKIECLS